MRASRAGVVCLYPSGLSCTNRPFCVDDNHAPGYHRSVTALWGVLTGTGQNTDALDPKTGPQQQDGQGSLAAAPARTHNSLAGQGSRII